MMYKLIVYRLTGPIGYVFVGVEFGPENAEEFIDNEIHRALGVEYGDYIGYQFA